MLLQAKGDLAAAEPLLREAFEGRHETLGSRHPDTLGSSNNLSLLLQAKGHLAAVGPLLHKVMAMMGKTPGSRLRLSTSSLAKKPRHRSAVERIY